MFETQDEMRGGGGVVDDIFIAKIKRVRLWRSIAVVVRIAVMIRLVTAPALFTSCFLKLALRDEEFFA